jgi:DNA-binding transcriptional LysR family regulator
MRRGSFVIVTSDPDVGPHYQSPFRRGNANVRSAYIRIDIWIAPVHDIKRIERRLKLHDMRVLMTVIEAGSMNRAAERLGTSQPAVSRAIAELERALAVRLLERTPGGIVPTQYGEAILKRGLAVFDELRQGVKDVEFLRDPTSGQLRIGCSEYAAGGPILTVVDRLTRQHPRMVFDIVTAPVLSLYRDLTERAIELVVTRLVEFADRRNMTIETLFEDDIVVVAAAQNPWTRRRRIELGDLVGEPWTLPPRDTGLGAFAEAAFRARGLEPPRAAVTTYSMHMSHKLLDTGRFLTMLPRYTLVLPRKHPSLKALPVELDDSRAPMALITLRGRALSPLGEMFVKNARAVTKLLATVR